MEKQRDAIKKSVDECSAELKSKGTELVLIEKSIKEKSAKLHAEEKKLDSVQKCSKQHAEELESKERSIVQCSKELESKQRNLVLESKSLKECRDELAMKERQFEERINKFELKEQQFYSMQKSLEERCKAVELKEKQLHEILLSQERIQQPENLTTNCTTNCLSISLQSCIEGNGRNLHFLLNDHLKKCDLVHVELSAAIKKSPEPAKFVLDAMQGFYPPGLKKGDMEFELIVIRQSCVTLLEQLLKSTPRIKPETREKAMKLACEWQAKMRVVPENSLEVFGFLQLLAAFKLASAFSVDKLQSLLSTIAQHRQATELRQALGIEDNLGGNIILSSQLKIEQPEHPQVSSPTYASSAVLLSTNIDERSLPLFPNECGAEHNFMPQEVLDALQLSPDPAKIVLDVIQDSHSQCWKNEVTGFDATLLRGKILLLEQLMKVSPKISPKVKEAAAKMAVHWKENIRLEVENSTEVLAFLLFLAIYGLVSFFRGEEILGLTGNVSLKKQAPELCRALGFTDMIPAFIENLLEGKQHMEAGRFSCAFGLVNMFPPDHILKECLENTKMDAWISKNGKNSLADQYKAIVKEVDALRAILECITDYKLESSFSTKNIIDRIVALEKKQATGRKSFKATASKDWPQLQGREHYHTGDISGARDQANPSPAVHPQLCNPSFRDQLQMQSNGKRPRVDT